MTTHNRSAKVGTGYPVSIDRGPISQSEMTDEQLEELIERRIKMASTETKSTDEVVQIAWLADGIDLWHRSSGKMGHSPANARRYIISSITRLIASQKAIWEREARAEGALDAVDEIGAYKDQFIDFTIEDRANAIRERCQAQLSTEEAKES